MQPLLFHDISMQDYIDVMASCNRHKKCSYTNIYMNYNEMAETISYGCSMVCNSDNAIFMVPRHDKFMDLLFFIGNLKSFDECIGLIKKEYQHTSDVRATLIGKETYIQHFYDTFISNGFELGRKIGRMVPGDAKNEYAIAYYSSCSGEINKRNQILNIPDIKFGYAESNDAEEIYNLLVEEFDVLKDNVPEVSKIRETINSTGIAVARYKSEIIAFRYTEIRNKIAFGLFDLVKRKYRGHQVHLYLSKFLEREGAYDSKRITRMYGWRDVTKTRLVKAYKLLGDVFDGVFIYNLVLSRAASI